MWSQLLYVHSKAARIPEFEEKMAWYTLTIDGFMPVPNAEILHFQQT